MKSVRIRLRGMFTDDAFAVSRLLEGDTELVSQKRIATSCFLRLQLGVYESLNIIVQSLSRRPSRFAGPRTDARKRAGIGSVSTCEQPDAAFAYSNRSLAFARDRDGRCAHHLVRFRIDLRKRFILAVGNPHGFESDSDAKARILADGDPGNHSGRSGINP
jgi:hypothetical protein